MVREPVWVYASQSQLQADSELISVSVAHFIAKMVYPAAVKQRCPRWPDVQPKPSSLLTMAPPLPWHSPSAPQSLPFHGEGGYIFKT